MKIPKLGSPKSDADTIWGHPSAASGPPHNCQNLHAPYLSIDFEGKMDLTGELILSREKGSAYCGSVKVPLHSLKHEEPEQSSRQLDMKNVNRLINIFKLEGCQRLEADNYVPTLVSKEAFARLLCLVGGEGAKLKRWDEILILFEPLIPLTFLHGRHRIEAGRRFLRQSEQWWVVDLFAEELLSPATRIAIREADNTASRFSDGDVFRHLRHCQRVQDRGGKKKWLSRLSITKQRDVLQLERRAEKELETAEFLNAWDDLIAYPGLWPALQLGTLHRLLSLRCPEVSSLNACDGKES